MRRTGLTRGHGAPIDLTMRARFRKHKGLIIGCTVVLLLAVLALTPWVWWRVQPSTDLDVLIVDKTVAKPNYREHVGLTWLLQHEKIRQRSTGAPLDVTRSYAGRQHGHGGSVRNVPIPTTPTDFAYIADVYGVYEDDIGPRSLGLKSDLIYGGLSLDEATALTRSIRPGGVLVGEFNSLASPTSREARLTLEEAFGVRWTGWIGRYFTFLDLTVDLPLWIPRTWKRQTGRRWDFRGPGYIFVSERGELVVLVEGIDTPPGAVTINFTSDAADRYGTARTHVWDNWFDIVETKPGTEVLANYRVALTERGKRTARGLPIEGDIPAVIRRDRPERLSYYFAGDFVDMQMASEAHRYKWLPKIKSVLAPENRGDQTAFYWRVYVPMMQRILGEAKDRAKRSDVQTAQP